MRALRNTWNRRARRGGGAPAPAGAAGAGEVVSPLFDAVAHVSVAAGPGSLLTLEWQGIPAGATTASVAAAAASRVHFQQFAAVVERALASAPA